MGLSEGDYANYGLIEWVGYEVYGMLTLVSYSFLVNGVPTDSLMPHRGLPVRPSLSLLVSSLY